MSDKKKLLNVTVERVLPEEIKPVWGNYFRFTRLDDNFVLEVGFIDPQQVVDIQEKYPKGNIPEGEKKIKANIVLNIGMSTGTFLKLKDTLEDMYNKSLEVGAIPKKEGSANE